jgi:hypothetical protein
LQNPGKLNGDNLNNVGHGNSRNYRHGKVISERRIKKTIRTTILETHRSIDNFKRSSKSKTGFTKYVNVNLLEDFNNILSRWMVYSSQILNICGV